MAKIKICGITRESETEVLNRMQVDYAGFVFFERSKRNVSIEQAKEIKKHLKPSIKTVAVTVNPALDLIDEIIEAGFDILQIHKMQEFPENLKIPVVDSGLGSISGAKHGRSRRNKCSGWYFRHFIRRTGIWQWKDFFLAGFSNEKKKGMAGKKDTIYFSRRLKQ